MKPYIETMGTKYLEEKLEIVKTNISDLVTWLDENSRMESIPDEIWKYIINIEKVVGISDEDTEPEYDSAGFTEEDRIVDGQYMTYVNTVKQNIDQATAEGILRDDCSEGYSYMSKETWLNAQADQEAQDYNTFGNNKI